MAFWYAKEMIKGRWKEAEPVIMQDPEHAYRYATSVIKDRWEEAEPYIMKDKFMSEMYVEMLRTLGYDADAEPTREGSRITVLGRLNTDHYWYWLYD